MKTFIFLVCLVLAVYAEEKYDTIGEDFNVSEVLENDRLLKSYIKCLLNTGACTPEVKKVKDKLPEALETNCAKCTDRQKTMGKQLAQAVQKRHPDLWKELVAVYDPAGKYQDAFKEFLAN